MYASCLSSAQRFEDKSNSVKDIYLFLFPLNSCKIFFHLPQFKLLKVLKCAGLWEALGGVRHERKAKPTHSSDIFTPLLVLFKFSTRPPRLRLERQPLPAHREPRRGRERKYREMTIDGDRTDRMKEKMIERIHSSHQASSQCRLECVS